MSGLQPARGLRVGLPGTQAERTSPRAEILRYIANDKFKPADSIGDDLVDIVSRNGALLLNVGPRPDGAIPKQAQRILLEIGKCFR